MGGLDGRALPPIGGAHVHAAILAIELYLLLVVVDVLLAWIQEDPTRVPRRFTHLLTEPFQRPIRSAWARLAPGRLDISPIVVVVLLGVVRVALVRA
jgi:uncharacterized protein YggT (Ycf19 family)